MFFSAVFPKNSTKYSKICRFSDCKKNKKKYRKQILTHNKKKVVLSKNCKTREFDSPRRSQCGYAWIFAFWYNCQILKIFLTKFNYWFKLLNKKHYFNTQNLTLFTQTVFFFSKENPSLFLLISLSKPIFFRSPP